MDSTTRVNADGKIPREPKNRTAGKRTREFEAPNITKSPNTKLLRAACITPYTVGDSVMT